MMMNSIMNQNCSADGLLFDMEKTYQTASKLLCSDSCPCNLVIVPDETNLTIDLAAGAYSIDRCHN
jgi:hypothetical protein